MLESGDMKAISQVQLGDRVLTVSMDGLSTRFSPVVSMPHKAGNTEQATFVHLTTETTGRDIKLTPEHLILAGACGSSAEMMSLVAAGKVTEGMCLMTVPEGRQDKVVSTKLIQGQGVYTIATQAGDLIVVNGIAASPFAVNHRVADAFHTVHRVLYALFPALLASQFVQNTIGRFGDLAVAASI